MKFTLSIEDKIITSKVMSKEKTEEKYTDSISSGFTGFISKYEEKMKNYIVNIGNLNPNKQVELKTVFIQMISSYDLSYEYTLMNQYPSFSYEESIFKDEKNKIIKAEFNIETQSKITRLIAPFINEEIKNKYFFEINYDKEYKKVKINYEINQNEINNNDDLNKDNKNSKHFSILFRTEDINKSILYQQYNPELKETAYTINYIYTCKNKQIIPIPEKPDEDSMISYYEKYETNILNETPGLFIFLIDQSGSM